MTRKSYIRSALEVAILSTAIGCTSSPKVEEKIQEPVSVKTVPTLGYKADYTTVKEFVRDNRAEVNYTEIWREDIPVITFGERHTSVTQKEEVIRHIPEFRRMGMTHLALELFTEDQQEVLTGYSNGTKTREEVKQLMHGWGHGEKSKEKNLEMIDAAKKEGIELLAIDMPDRVELAKRDFSGDLLIDGLYMETHNLDLIPPLGVTPIRRDSSTVIRNGSWARIIEETIAKDPKARILVYGGSAHFGFSYDGEFNSILKGKGIKSEAVNFVGTFIPSQSHEEIPSDIMRLVYSVEDGIGWGAKALGIADNRFVVRVQDSKDGAAEDYSYRLHLPQKETLY